MPKPDLTVKVTGYQWYWGYAYPDQKIDEITSTLMPEDEAKAKGLPFRLAANNPMVVPVGKVVRVLVTGADVIHSWANPAFGTKIDANPGRLNETWVKVDRPGVYFGQCSELCGARHGFMPIAVEVVPEATFNAWLASKGGQPKAAIEAKAKAEAAAAKAAAAAVPAAPAPTGDNAVAPAEGTTNQAATAQN
jgi:cytochrome c oxidase subunit 2